MFTTGSTNKDTDQSVALLNKIRFKHSDLPPSSGRQQERKRALVPATYERKMQRRLVSLTTGLLIAKGIDHIVTKTTA
jgi:hypothetical protein